MSFVQLPVGGKMGLMRWHAADPVQAGQHLKETPVPLYLL